MAISQVRLSSDPKTIGVKNGVYQAELHVADELNELIHNTNFKWQPRHKDLVTCFPLETAIPTDFTSFSPYLTSFDFLLSERAAKLLDGERGIQIERIRVEKANNLIWPDLMFLVKLGQIDFESFEFSDSVIYSGNELLGKSYHNISNLEDYHELCKTNPLHSFERVSIRNKDMLDFFSIRGVGFFIADKIMSIIEANSFSGLDIPLNSIEVNNLA